MDGLNNPVVDYSNKIILDTGKGTGTWSLAEGNGAFIETGKDSGVATYTFEEKFND